MSRPRPTARREAGFTLIETMAVVVILGVLAAVAIGAYSKQVRNAHKTEVIADLSNMTLRQKSWFGVNGHYASTTGCEGPTCTYPLGADLTAANGPLRWDTDADGYTATGLTGAYFRDGDAVHGFDALRFLPEGGDSWCGYAAVSGWGANAEAGSDDVPPTATLADQIFPAATADAHVARDWFYAYALCDFDFDGTYWAFTTAHYTSEVNQTADNTGTYLENE